MKFDEKMQILEDLIKEMESPEISLEDSLEKYTTAVKLISECQKQLDEAKEKTAKLFIVEEV